jgi:hypothetical protein
MFSKTPQNESNEAATRQDAQQAKEKTKDKIDCDWEFPADVLS